MKELLVSPKPNANPMKGRSTLNIKALMLAALTVALQSCGQPGAIESNQVSNSAIGGAGVGAVAGLLAGAEIGVSPALPTRAFSGPSEYPPLEFPAYGIVAFPSRAVSEDLDRYEMICEAFIASLPSHSEISTPLWQQMVTIWPIESDDEADMLDDTWGDVNAPPCGKAVSSYGLPTALEAISEARRSNAILDGPGPFLLAWSPPSEMGQPRALVLISDLSDVTNTAQAKDIFERWGRDIEENPALWSKGWNMEKMRIAIRLWADKYGSNILNVFESDK